MSQSEKQSLERRPRALALTCEAASRPYRGLGTAKPRSPEAPSSTGSAAPATAPRTLPGPKPRPQHDHPLTGIILDPNRMDAGVRPRPGRAQVARGSRTRVSPARTRPRARRPTCCKAAARLSPQPSGMSPRPRPTPLAGPRDATRLCLGDRDSLLLLLSETN